MFRKADGLCVSRLRLAEKFARQVAMPSCLNSGGAGPWCQGWRRKEPPRRGLALTLGLRRSAGAGHEAQARANVAVESLRASDGVWYGISPGLVRTPAS